MGVPRLFPWIKKTFKKTVKYFFVGNYTNQVDYLYIDANGLLHTAAQQVYNYGSAERKPGETDPYSSLEFDAKIHKTFDVFFLLVCEVIKISPPSRVLFIAIDGPAPLAKQAQQRQRRFVAQTQRTKDTVFDSNCITPGTKFMFKLTQYLNFAIREKMNTDEWPFEVCFSSALVPGEGEHKIMDYIRCLPKHCQTDARHCFFGLDADLIMLTLASPCTTMFLLREDQYNQGFYYSIDIQSIRVNLTWVFRESYPRAVSDFLVVGFFVGNDFLPKIPMFLLLEDGLNFMIDARHKIGRALTSSRGTIDVDGFTQFVVAIAAEEPWFLEQQASRKMPSSKFVNHTLLQCVRQGKLDYAAYRTAYYEKAGGSSPQKIDEMCRDYLQGILWVCAYYFHGVPSWEWCYTWHYAPLLGDLARYLLAKGFDEIPLFSKGEPSVPFVQLLSVLPPQSASLLPASYRGLMQSSSSPLVVQGVYPESFSVDYEGKTKEHMGVAILSFVDRKMVIDAYNTVPRSEPPNGTELRSASEGHPFDVGGREGLTNRRAETQRVLSGRNKKGDPVRFWVDPSFRSRFVSPFGTVCRNRVRREKY